MHYTYILHIIILCIDDDNDDDDNNQKKKNILHREEKEQHASQDKQFFAGVSKVFGKKTGDFLMNKFDPTLTTKTKHKRGARRY